MNTAAKGRRLEHKTRERLEAEGYDVLRSAASKGSWDLVAIRATDIRLVQVKANAWPGSVEMESMQLTKVPANCSREVWRWDDRAREPRVRVL